MKRIKKVLVVLMIFVMVFALVSCKGGDDDKKVDEGQIKYEQTYENGQTEFTFKVVNKEGVEKYFLIKTDKVTVSDALLEVGLINGSQSSYGLYVTEVNGEALDWDKDQMYWAFYIDGEYAVTGVDMTNVETGKVYSFEASK